MNKLKVAFDIGNSSLKIAVFKGHDVKLYEQRIPENVIDNDRIALPDTFAQFLKAVKKELNLPNGPVGIILPYSDYICKTITMPLMTKDQLEINLPYEFNDFITGDPEQFFCDYALCEPTKEEEENNEITITAAVAPKDVLTSYIDMFELAGFKVSTVLPKEIALINIVKANSEKLNENEFCFVDIGQNSINICMIEKDRIKAQRQITIGCKQIDEIVADILNIDPFLVDSYKRTNSNNVLDNDRCVDVYNRILVEIVKVINFYQFTYRNNNLNGVYIIGGGANVEKLKNIIADGVDMQILDAAQLINGNNEQSICKTALAVSGVED